MSAAELLAWGFATLLVSIRLSVLFVAAPVFASVPVPATARIILVMTLAVGLALGVTPPPELLSGFALAGAALGELIIGAAFAVGLFAGFGAFQFGGRLLDFQIGFGMANLVDIATRSSGPLLGTLLLSLGVLVFFTVDGHLVLLRMLKLSLERIPPGSSVLDLDFAALVAQFSACFVFGLALVAPVVLALFLVDTGMAFMSRTMPQMNVFLIALALKAVVGLVLLAITLPFAGGLMQRIFDSIAHGHERILG